MNQQQIISTLFYCCYFLLGRVDVAEVVLAEDVDLTLPVFGALDGLAAFLSGLLDTSFAGEALLPSRGLAPALVLMPAVFFVFTTPWPRLPPSPGRDFLKTIDDLGESLEGPSLFMTQC